MGNGVANLCLVAQQRVLIGEGSRFRNKMHRIVIIDFESRTTEFQLKNCTISHGPNTVRACSICSYCVYTGSRLHHSLA